MPRRHLRRAVPPVGRPLSSTPVDHDRLQSLLIAADRELGPITPVLDPASTFAAEGPEEFARMATEPRHGRFYTRYGNPTHRHAEALVAAAEETEGAQLFASGMAAVSAVVLT